MSMMLLTSCGKTQNEVEAASADSSAKIRVIAEKGPRDETAPTAAVSGNKPAEGADPAGTAADVSAAQEPDIAVWYPYWDYATADRELELIGEDLTTICFFAAYFDVNNRPFIPQDTSETYKRLSKAGKLSGRNTYLTFVNDKLLAQGSSLKDTDLLYELIGDRTKAKAHAQEVIRLTKELGCTGIEIDYEAIKKDQVLWGHFNDFITILAEETQASSMPLRVVFEPSAPIDLYEWPASPEYVMMCYNLKGYGTEPGPKANIAWIRELSEKMKVLGGRINLAFASGGFDFGADGTTAQIDYAKAVKLVSGSGAEPQRDEKSGALYAAYEDENGGRHEIWYADQETLKKWIGTAGECGIKRFSIWRLGGNINS
ncbi:MAG: glycosyl hydrolase [Lachnospiraceae bacterium]|nr:glycosyl hydrolase [Lachnospiraceae bacterium]